MFEIDPRCPRRVRSREPRVSGVLAYDSRGNDNTALTLGGTVGATAHLPLGLGAFFRPGIAIGALFGKHELPMGAGVVEEANQTAYLARLSFPLAYFVGRRVVLQAGPQLDAQLGSYKPMAGEAQTFSRTNGGFAVAAGYAFQLGAQVKLKPSPAADVQSLEPTLDAVRRDRLTVGGRRGAE
ncbi:MAG TPA: hypothetical protein VM513_06085 [Kofleriaceae bacterium]|nr:hypothetical protein [Kofleriaceae bacterium]